MRTCFFGHADIQHRSCGLAERRLRAARHRDQRNAEPLDDRQDRQQLGGLAGIGDRDHDVVVRQHADVAMAGFGRVQEKSRRTRARKRGGDLVADVTRFAHPGYDHATGAIVQQTACLDECGAEPTLQRRDRGNLSLQDASATRQQLVGVERGGPRAGMHAANHSALS
jgi:hypothetical protein